MTPEEENYDYKLSILEVKEILLASKTTLVSLGYEQPTCEQVLSVYNLIEERRNSKAQTRVTLRGHNENEGIS
ncbi:MAG: hypothetical protein ACRDBG_00825 [Waterburya sp.]